uniref:Ig-like domain-containing protein n=1 Tax=Bubo bubo TaxID=30461 RepID=A0A8C0IBQ8_BUBBB
MPKFILRCLLFLTGEVGGSVTHQCFYSITPANKHDRKYWCKIAGNRVCYTIISTTGYTSKDYAGRVSLEDTPQKGTFTVMMTELKKSDTGTYRCGIGITNGDLYVTLNLTVLAGRMLLVWGELHGSVMVLCPPGDIQGGKKRFWCKLGRTGCTLIADTDGYVGKSYQGRIFITPQESSGAFKILINDLKKEDSGLYRCGTGRPNEHTSSLKPEIVYGLLNGSVTVKCFYPPTSVNRHDRKYWCRESARGCTTIVSTSGYTAPGYQGRVLMSSEDTPGSFSIMITQMGWKDSGLYLCGVVLHLQLLISFLSPESKVPQAKPIITGVKGSSATFECRYNPLQRSSGRYWCKWRQGGCARIIDTSGYVSYPYEGRVAIFDSPENMTMTVILNQLSDKDNGYYWCMTDEQKEQQTSTELKIIDGQPGLTGKKEVEAQVGSRLDLTCYYPCKYYSYQKYWCKWNNTGCSVLPASDQRQPGPGVTCDRDNKTVILSFDPVEKTNEGWYWCGVKRNGVYGETMAVQLSVTGGELQGRGGQGFSCSPGLQIIPPSAERDLVTYLSPHSSSDKSHGSSTLTLALSLAGAALLVLVTAFAVYKYRQLKRSDLVSIGSYRTNISMSDFESVKGYSASNNACVKESQETEIGGEEPTDLGDTTTAFCQRSCCLPGALFIPRCSPSYLDLVICCRSASVRGP